jgi:hypothetical protein
MITPPRDDENLASASNRSSRTVPYTGLIRTALALGPNYDRHLSTDNSHSCVQLLHTHRFTFLVDSIDSNAFRSDADDPPIWRPTGCFLSRMWHYPLILVLRERHRLYHFWLSTRIARVVQKPCRSSFGGVGNCGVKHTTWMQHLGEEGE